jgi:basic membrane protein A and related proteins
MRQRKRLLGVVSLAAVLGLLTAACGSDNNDNTSSTEAAPGESTGGGSSDAGKGVSVCQVSDTGGINDKGFNQSAWDGVKEAQDKLGVSGTFLESKTDADYATNIQSFIDKKCNLIITVGFLLDAATATAAKANAGTKFAIVDSAAKDNNGTPDDPTDDVKLPNVRALNFATDQPSFLAGYLAAGMSKSGTVGTYGGVNIPPVTIFMTGFLNGVKYYNQQKGKDVKVLGWDGKDGTFAGNFDKTDDGKRIAQSQVDEGADIVFPVAGPVGLGTAALATELGADKLTVIGVDVDQFLSNETDQDVYLTSVMKGIQASVFDTVNNVVKNGALGDDYVGTLANGGGGLAPFHNFDDKVPADLKSELDKIKQDIIDGKIKTDQAPA